MEDVKDVKDVKATKAEWLEIWESDEYKAEIYDNCTIRVYAKAGKDKLKIEQDGTRWVGNTGGFHIYKYFVAGKTAENLRQIIAEFDNDEASEDDVIRVINSICE